MRKMESVRINLVGNLKLCALAPLTLDYVALSFEFLAASLTTNSTCFTLLVIYRPPSHKPNQFIDEFASLLEFLVHSPGLLLIVDDFNIHVDDKSCKLGQSFLSLIDSFDLQQHVSDSTHIGGHTLDLVLSRSSDNFLVDCSTSDFISDNAIHWCAKAHRPLRPVKKVEFRKLKSIDFSSFCSDLLKLPLLTSPAGDCESALLQYNNGLALALHVFSTHTLQLSKDASLFPQIIRGTMRRSMLLEER